MANYKILEGRNLKELEEKVNESITNGYVPLGGVVIKQVLTCDQNSANALSVLRYGETIYVQAMLNNHYTKPLTDDEKKLDKASTMLNETLQKMH